MFTKLLIANRGEIACRVAATARRLGIRTVAVYSAADADAPHVQACDEARLIGPPPARESYLKAAALLDAARASGATAVHPGYGFLSENAAFAQACADAGLVFVGPPPQAIALMGSKSAAKALMESAGVPLLPGYHGDRQEADFLLGEAERIGWPVLIKASAGGGGRGMRIVHQPSDFPAALAACQREAEAAFGDGRVLLERYLNKPRHIEVQVFGDRHGNLVHLFERDCSVQRRHQKVIEEAPAPGLLPAQREALGAAAVAAARSVGYTNAGTVEFIAEALPPTAPGGPAGVGRFYFMEMNTRLQVEHPVTEALTGLDLVEWQLRVAAGEPLPLAQAELSWQGHALEARICAEDAGRGFLPGSGRLALWRPPPNAAAFAPAPLRLDSGCAQGAEVTPHYDSMLAKLIAHGRTRAEALARLDAGLAALHAAGPPTNIAFLRRLIASPSFARADLDTALIDREGPLLLADPEPPLAPLLAALAARLLHDEAHAAPGTAGPPDIWARGDAWRLHGPARRLLRVLPGAAARAPGAAPAAGGAGRTVDLEILRWRDGRCELAVAEPRDDRATAALGPTPPLPWSARPRGADSFDITLGGLSFTATVWREGAHFEVFSTALRGQAWLADPLTHRPAAAGAAGPAAGAARLAAPLPGKVVALLVQAGQAVRAGQPLAVTEAMKMEHTLTAPHDGEVEALLVAAGDQVAEGTELLRLRATTPAPPHRT